MPQIELIPDVSYQPDQPYHWAYDNLPLANFSQRQDLINYAVDINTDILRQSIGTQGTLANRLNQSIEQDGSLKTDAVDASLHNIGLHTDGSATVADLTAYTNLGYTVTNPVPFVRIIQQERDKLALISSDASALRLQVETISNTQLFEDETVRVVDSDTVTWTLEPSSAIKAHMAFPANAAHINYYSLTVTNVSAYTTFSTPVPYVAGTLRVTINGIRIFPSVSGAVFVPPYNGPNGSWLSTYILSEVSSTGNFTLNRALTSNDKIFADFDTNFV